MRYLKAVLPHFLKSTGKRLFLDIISRKRIMETATLSEAFYYTPLSTIKVSLDRIDEMMVPGQELYREYTPGCVVGGNWDKQTKPFKNSMYYQSLKNHFVNNYPWPETRLYQSAINRNPDSSYHGCKTADEIQARMEYVDNIYKSIKENGYLNQRQLQRRAEGKPSSTPPELREVRINIDRYGTPIFDDGRHRLAIAKILDIDKIPVIVIGRHRKWWKQGGKVTDIAD